MLRRKRTYDPVLTGAPTAAADRRTADVERQERSRSEDQELVDAAQAGDQASFERLVTKYEASLRRVVFGLVRDHGLAEDIAQDAFLRAYRKLKRLHDGRAFQGWLFTIGLNEARDELRRRSRRPSVPEEVLEAVPDETVATSDHSSMVSEKGQFLQAVLIDLPKKMLEPLILKHVQDYTYSEIAEMLQIPMGTVQIRIHRARIKLRQKLAELGLDSAESASALASPRPRVAAALGGQAQTQRSRTRRGRD